MIGQTPTTLDPVTDATPLCPFTPDTGIEVTKSCPDTTNLGVGDDAIYDDHHHQHR